MAEPDGHGPGAYGACGSRPPSVPHTMWPCPPRSSSRTGGPARRSAGLRVVPGPLDGAERLRGRLRCAACGADTTAPWPTDAELDAAYGALVPAGGGPLLGRRRRVLRRLARPAGPAARRGSPRRARCSTSGAGDGALLDALRHGGRPAVGLERDSERADVRAGELADARGPCAAVVFWHSLEHLRDAGRGARARGRPARAGRRARGRDPEPGSLQARAVRRPLARTRPPAPPRPRAGAGAARAARAARAAGRAGQLPARRPGRVRLAARDRRRAPGPPRPLRRDPPPRGPPAGRSPRQRAPATLAAAAALLPVAAARGRRRPRRAAAAPSTWRPAVSCARTRATRLTAGHDHRHLAADPRGPTSRRARSSSSCRRSTRPDARADLRRHPARLGRRDHPRRRQVDRRHRRASRATLPRPRRLAPAQRRLRRQPEDLLPEALQRDADVVVMLHPDGQYEPQPDPQAGRADPRAARPTSCSARASPSPARAREGGMPL